jgi:hypothetical protein
MADDSLSFDHNTSLKSPKGANMHTVETAAESPDNTFERKKPGLQLQISGLADEEHFQVTKVQGDARNTEVQ